MFSEYLLSSKHEELSTTADLRFFGTTTVNVQKAANDTENQFNRYCLTYTAGMPVRAKIQPNGAFSAKGNQELILLQL